MIDVSILIVNFQTAQSVLAVVDSIHHCTHDVSYEIIVVDNASSESDRQWLRTDNRFQLIELPQNMGFGKANNVAAQAAQGKYIFCLNPDTIILNNAIQILASYLDSHPAVGIVGGNLYNAQHRPAHSYHQLMPGIFSELDFACGQVFRRILFGKNAQFNHTNLPLSVAMITGADLMIRRAIWTQLKGFDESFFMYNEDADLCYRTKELGYDIVNEPTAHIQHLEGLSTQNKINKIALTLAGRNTYFHKHYSRRYCEWANRLFRLTSYGAGLLFCLMRQKEKQEYYLQRAKECVNQAPVLINGRFLLRKPTGVEQYAINMTRALMQENKYVEVICPRLGTISEAYDLSGLNIIRRGWSAGHLWEQCFLPLYRFFHHEGHLVTFCGLGSILCHHEIMTIHDLSFLDHPQWFSRSYAFFYRIFTPLVVRSSRAILTVSHYSATRITQAYPVAASKIHIVPCALPTSFEANKMASSQREKYFLSVASLDPRKNTSSLILLMQQHPEWHLKLVGSSSRVFASDHIVSVPSNVELLGYVDQPTLSQLYAHANAFIFPSLYEGFGIPPLEAMSLGCPVLCSDIPVLHEVLEDSPIYFQPTDLSSISQAIRTISNMTDEERSSMINKGYQQVKKYSWQHSAQILLDILYY